MSPRPQVEPFQTENLAEFAFKPTSSGVEVTWSMSGKNPLFRKVFGLFIDMDSMIGKDFERGLADLGAAAKSAALSLPSTSLTAS